MSRFAKPIRVYVAGKFSDKDAVRAAQNTVIVAGGEISHDWTSESIEGLSGEVLQAYRTKCAAASYRGVFSADAYLLLCHPEGRGSLIELGMAIALEKPCYIVSPERADNIFWHLPDAFFVKRFATVEEAVASLTTDYARRTQTR